MPAVLVALGVLAGCGGAREGHATAAATECLAHRRPPLCYAPSQFRTAYGLQLLLAEGIDGRGRTVVLLEATIPHPSVGATVIQQDLALYEKRFGIPSSTLDVISANPRSPSAVLATPEEVLDVETLHAIAPGAAIRIIQVRPAEARSARLAALVGAIKEAVARNLGDIISASVGVPESCLPPAERNALHAALRAARDRHITVIAASGDSGAASEPCAAQGRAIKGVPLPASDPLVTAVGGSRLLADPRTGAYIKETAWNKPPPTDASRVEARPSASGGGFSHVFPRPDYQSGEVAGTARGVPDVAADADPTTGLALLAYVRRERIVAAGGTSAAAPFWAGIIALSDQLAGRRLGFVNPALYRIAGGPRYHAAFHDITQGDNSVSYPSLRIRGYQASPGWDAVTGLGSPNAQVLVPLLAHSVRPGDGHGL